MTQVVQRLAKRAAGLFLVEIGPEEAEKDVTPLNPAWRREGEIGEEGEPLGLDSHRGCAGRVGGQQLESPECVESQE